MDNPSAFPIVEKDGVYDREWGMSLRDWFAGQALVALGSILAVNKRTDGGTIKEEHLAKMAYAVADAMLAARAKDRFTVPPGEDVTYPPAERYEEGN